MARIMDRKDEWFEIWTQDKESIIDCMVRNMTADLNAGYDYFGKSIREQVEMIAEYKAEYDAQMSEFWKMTEEQVDRWCFYDLKKRGAIA